ncbi:MAG: class I SAM-dependent methyltransferase [Planctomycetaceae bacterium]
MRNDDDAYYAALHQLRETPALVALVNAADEGELALQKRLRKEFPDDVVRAAIGLQEMRQRGTAKFTRAAAMWFDRIGLEQATSETVARHKAARFSGAVDDLCCGIGGDAIALAERCAVTAVDSRGSAALMTTWNAQVYGVAGNITACVADVEQQPGTSPLVQIDPDRRRGARRSVRIEDYRPGLPFLEKLIATRGGGAIKLSPASNFGGKFPGCEIELISLHGECKEATVWFGSLAGEQPWRATVLPSGETIAADPLAARAPIRPLGRYVHDPDPAVVRSGLLDVAAVSLGLDRLDEEEEYLTGDRLVSSGFVRAFEVLADLPNNERQIRRTFRESGFGQVEIKSRHVPVDADAVRRKLPLPGNEPGVLIYARVAGRTRALICRRVLPELQ